MKDSRYRRKSYLFQYGPKESQTIRVKALHFLDARDRALIRLAEKGRSLRASELEPVEVEEIE